MRIVSWNVNGLRAVLKNTGKSLKQFLDNFEAEIICLQETKATKEQLDRSNCSVDGYTSFFSFSKVKGGYSGVVTFCHKSATPVCAEEGLTGALTEASDVVGHAGHCQAHFTSKEAMLSFDGEGRAILTEHTYSSGDEGGEVGGGGREGPHLVVINVYCPMVDRENVKTDRLDYKLLFYSVLQDRCTALEEKGKKVIVAGDLNCSREAIDSAYIQDTPALLHGSPEREWMKQFVTTAPPPSPSSPCLLVDTFRHLNPTQAKAYTCWSTFLGYRKTNYGTRIDYILCSSGLASLLSKAEVWAHVLGSDHCPVMAEFAAMTISPSLKPPSLSCTARQTKLSTFLARPHPSVQEATSGSSAEVTDPTSISSAKGVKRKLCGGHRPAVKSRKSNAVTLKSFFDRSSPNLGLSDGVSPSCEVTDDQLEPEGERGSGSAPPAAPSSSQLCSEWLSVFSGPPKPPLCKGHSEPAVLRTVRKSGPNRGRQFWVCSRPGGSKNDPTTQCDFFQWLNRSKPKVVT